jgi:hypothetical protein
MPDPSAAIHPPEFVELCRRAEDGLRALLAAQPMERGRLIPALRELLVTIDEQIDELDIRLPGFADEQAALGDAYSALQSIDMDRGGPHVERYVNRAIADIRRVAG